MSELIMRNPLQRVLPVRHQRLRNRLKCLQHRIQRPRQEVRGSRQWIRLRSLRPRRLLSRSKLFFLTVINTKAEQYTSHISSDIVTFLVGPKRRTFKIHHSLICSASGYFKTMLRRSLSGRPITEKYLPNHDAEAFSLFVTYLYRGSFSDIILTSPKAGEDRVICTDQTHEFNVDKLVKLCFIAMDWDIPALYNYVVDYLIRYVSKHWKRLPLVTIAAIAANTKDDSDPLRRLAIDQVVFIMQPTSEPRRQKEYIDRMIQIVSLEFLGAVLKGVVEPWTPADPLKAPPCTYHRHKEGERCP